MQDGEELVQNLVSYRCNDSVPQYRVRFQDSTEDEDEWLDFEVFKRRKRSLMWWFQDLIVEFPKLMGAHLLLLLKLAPPDFVRSVVKKKAGCLFSSPDVSVNDKAVQVQPGISSASAQTCADRPYLCENCKERIDGESASSILGMMNEDKKKTEQLLAKRPRLQEEAITKPPTPETSFHIPPAVVPTSPGTVDPEPSFSYQQSPQTMMPSHAFMTPYYSVPIVDGVHAGSSMVLLSPMMENGPSGLDAFSFASAPEGPWQCKPEFRTRKNTSLRQQLRLLEFKKRSLMSQLRMAKRVAPVYSNPPLRPPPGTRRRPGERSASSVDVKRLRKPVDVRTNSCSAQTLHPTPPVPTTVPGRNSRRNNVVEAAKPPENDRKGKDRFSKLSLRLPQPSADAEEEGPVSEVIQERTDE